MPTLVASIRTALGNIAAKFADGAIEWRTLTSAPNANPRTYGAWVTVQLARCVEFGESQLHDMETGVWYREETCQLRVPFQSAIALTVRDQVRYGPATAGVGPDNFIWSVREQTMSSAGAVQSYMLYRRTPMLGNLRQGGV